MLGTAGNLLVPRSTPGKDPRLIHAHHVGAPAWLSLGGTLSGGAQEWLRTALGGATHAELDADAERVASGAEGLLFSRTSRASGRQSGTRRPADISRARAPSRARPPVAGAARGGSRSRSSTPGGAGVGRGPSPRGGRSERRRSEPALPADPLRRARRAARVHPGQRRHGRGGGDARGPRHRRAHDRRGREGVARRGRSATSRAPPRTPGTARSCRCAAGSTRRSGRPRPGSPPSADRPREKTKKYATDRPVGPRRGAR